MCCVVLEMCPQPGEGCLGKAMARMWQPALPQGPSAQGDAANVKPVLQAGTISPGTGSGVFRAVIYPSY